MAEVNTKAADYIRRNDKPTLGEFMSLNIDLVAEVFKLEEDPLEAVNHCYEALCKAQKKKYVKGQYKKQHTALKAAVKKKLTAGPHPLRQTTSSSSPSYQVLLTQAEKDRIEDMFNKLDESKMWPLSTGTKVELIMKKKALGCNFEHPSQSLILDTTDLCWTEPSYFSETEMQEIINYQQQKDALLAELTAELGAFVEGLKGKKTFDEIWAYAKTVEPNPRKEIDLLWVQETIQTVAKLFMKNEMLIFHPKTSEMDKVMDIWNFIKTVFQNTGVQIVRSSASLASSERKNVDRHISGEEKMDKMLEGEMSDLHVYYGDYELSASEFGLKYNGANDTKRKLESSVKVPKMLKDILMSLFKVHPSLLRSFKIPGFVVNDLVLKLILLDCPAGYVSRVCLVKDQLHFPSTVTTIAKKLGMLIKVVFNFKELVMEQIDIIEEDDDSTLKSNDSEIDIPPCFTTDIGVPHKRQRTSSSDE